MAREGFNDIGNFYFEDKVHTTFKVKAEVNFIALALAIGVLLKIEEVVHRLIGDRVKVSSLGFCVAIRSLLSIALHTLCKECEGQLVQTNKCQKYGKDPYSSFVLHCENRFYI